MGLYERDCIIVLWESIILIRQESFGSGSVLIRNITVSLGKSNAFVLPLMYEDKDDNRSL